MVNTTEDEKMPTSQSNSEKYLPARVLQVVGLVLLVGFAVFWGVTGRESVLLMSAAMTLVLLGAYKGAVDALKGQTRDKQDV